jgi:hypothetical protein
VLNSFSCNKSIVPACYNCQFLLQDNVEKGGDIDDIGSRSFFRDERLSLKKKKNLSRY